MKKKRTIPEGITDGIMIKNLHMVSHINMTTEHLSKKVGSFECEGKPLHGKGFTVESKTKVLDFMAGKYGKSKSTYYLNEPGSPMFDTIEELVYHYHGQA